MEFREKEETPTEMEYFFYLIIVKKASAEENEEVSLNSSGGGGVPKFYLKPVTILPLDTFAATHSPFTQVDGRHSIESRQHFKHYCCIVPPTQTSFVEQWCFGNFFSEGFHSG